MPGKHWRLPILPLARCSDRTCDLRHSERPDAKSVPVLWLSVSYALKGCEGEPQRNGENAGHADHVDNRQPWQAHRIPRRLGSAKCKIPPRMPVK
jgi:hypothetical protein